MQPFAGGGTGARLRRLKSNTFPSDLLTIRTLLMSWRAFMAKKDTPSSPQNGKRLNRRLFLLQGGTAAAGAALGGAALFPSSSRGQSSSNLIHPPFRLGEPFQLGVASGDPLSDAVVIWTRLAPRPLDPDGGMPNRPVARATSSVRRIAPGMP
jgi:PhoD-like phosphatase, N-terminal domain